MQEVTKMRLKGSLLRETLITIQGNPLRLHYGKALFFTNP
jgi:hypothetical protein